MLLSARPMRVRLALASGHAKPIRPTLWPRLQVLSHQRLQPAGVADSASDGLSTHQVNLMLRQPQLVEPSDFQKLRLERKRQRTKEAMAYRFSAIAATVLVLSIAVVATYYRFHWHLAEEGDVPLDEVAATLLLVFGGIFGMEMYARYAHKVLWHDFEPGWALHKSHHEPRTGPFEANDIYAVVNAVPAMALCLYGFLTPHVTGGVCFGAGLGITLFGIMYMFFHDGLVHRRFPVGPIAEVPYMKRIMVAHQIHHSNKFGGVPFGMFLGPQELEAVPGGKEELDRLMAALEAREAEMKQQQAVAP
ncbi:beta-carotene hydroxylase chloroplast precursor [Volvox carteri f. nagariensis]|uniref:beta-carotene 3-hydroxylase n=1 Tax=Volvox carteri f. nagariensis TaxID=3068 RepID=D8UFZ6_VOLCA|nr:beta-carotene hydroxylase chloroplast precursor [Volvox carteri f. nagariensis]EFJ41365.1 beta-carotene hydroxylase chloroplast precursor [Volvox carteri f. nagariensis]|eukprot:XP_002957595.1 beta-carotene hydroxylase chloroplast precursor [Volvox carteri f. nagariensis]